MTTATGDWIQTYTGRHVDPFALTPDVVAIEDIAHALAQTARFGGHARQLYTVGQHSLLVSAVCPAEHALWGLLHDAAEAYLGDIPRPIKRHLAGYAEAEAAALRVIAQRFGLSWPMPAIVKALDTSALRVEADRLMGATHDWRDLAGTTPPIDPAALDSLLDLPSPQVEQLFVERYTQLTAGRPRPA